MNLSTAGFSNRRSPSASARAGCHQHKADCKGVKEISCRRFHNRSMSNTPRRQRGADAGKAQGLVARIVVSRPGCSRLLRRREEREGIAEGEIVGVEAVAQRVLICDKKQNGVDNVIAEPPPVPVLPTERSRRRKSPLVTITLASMPMLVALVPSAVSVATMEYAN